MLDKESKNVYDVLKKLTGEDDVFKIIEADEIIEQLPEVMTKVQLSAVIRDLRDREYVKVKYFTPDEYCILTLKKAEEIAQIAEEVAAVAQIAKPVEAVGSARNAAVKTSGGKAFLASFLGALLGSGIIAAIALVIVKFVL